LSQIVDGEEHPVGYISTQLTPAQKNYSATELECTAVVWAFKQFESYLIDKPFTVVTDHSALQWLPRKNSENKRLARAAIFLSQFNYTVKHRSGAKNANADALSRQPVQAANCQGGKKLSLLSLAKTKGVTLVFVNAVNTSYPLFAIAAFNCIRRVQPFGSNQAPAAALRGMRRVLATQQSSSVSRHPPVAQSHR
jgi:hypothetical protein